MEMFIPIFMTFVGLVWLILHYVTKWKTAPTLTQDDEVMLDELYHLARRLEERMETVERLVADDDPDFRSRRQFHDGDDGVTPIDFNQTKERTRR